MQAIPLIPRQQKARKTYSICPVCKQRLPALLKKREHNWYMEKECPEHGSFNTVVWRGVPDRPEWTGHTPEPAEADVAHCPEACGICSGHKRGTCCVLLEITERCDLACSFCFAEAQADKADDPPGGLVKSWISDIARGGESFLQLSGGEPTLRDDLPELVRHAKQQGCRYVQLNSNGLRLAQEEDFVRKLAQAGLSFVFLQFDGMADPIYKKLRGRPLLAEKMQAIENCGRHNVGVTLVPTVVPGINDQAIGDIIRFAVSRSPVVRGVHLQPVSYFGRHPVGHATVPDEKRMTLPEVYRAIFAQAGDIVPSGSIVPSRCDHPACGFHGAYIVTPKGLQALSSKEAPPCCPSESAAERNRRFVGSRWERPAPVCCDAPNTHCNEITLNDGKSAPGGFCADTTAQAINASNTTSVDLNSLDGFLKRAKSHAFTLSAMAFQDAANLDLERLQQCTLHVYDNGRIVPFCSHYIFR